MLKFKDKIADVQPSQEKVSNLFLRASKSSISRTVQSRSAGLVHREQVIRGHSLPTGKTSSSYWRGLSNLLSSRSVTVSEPAQIWSCVCRARCFVNSLAKSAMVKPVDDIKSFEVV